MRDVGKRRTKGVKNAERRTRKKLRNEKEKIK